MKTLQFISMPEEQHEIQPAFFLEREDSQSRFFSRENFRQGILILGLVFLLCGLRFLHLDADTPIWLKTFSMGEYVDEGYKTLSPRNLALFGRTHWHPLDNYPGWMQSSPITSWSNYAAFKLFGPRLEAARFVTILFFTGFLLAFFFAFRGRYPAPILLCGLLLLGLAPALFLFSRIALFEAPMIFFIYGWMFLLTRQKEESIWMPIAAGILVAALIAYGIKFSALIYIGPMLVKAMPSGSSVIGDWAPFFALGTDLRPLYMNDAFNVVERLPVLRPDYFLYCDTGSTRIAPEKVGGLKGVHLGSPLFAAKYVGRTLALYPIHYAAQSQSSSAPALEHSQTAPATEE